MPHKFKKEKIIDLVRRPHLSDFPYHLSRNPVTKFRKYKIAQEISSTSTLEQKNMSLISRLRYTCKFKKTKLFADRSPTVSTITRTKNMQNMHSITEPTSTLESTENISKSNHTLLIYIDGLSPCLFESNLENSTVMRNTNKIFRSGFMHNKYFSTAEWTLPNLVSMFSGLLPSQHAITNSGSSFGTSYLEPEFINIFQYLSRFNIKTNIFSAVPYMNPNFGFNLGTDYFFYHKNLPAKKLIPNFRNFFQENKSLLQSSRLDCIFLMDVHHKLDGTLSKWDLEYEPFIPNISENTRLSIQDTKNLISRAIETDLILKDLLDEEVLEFYDHLVLVSDHGSARLRKSQELCVDDARTRTSFCLKSKSNFFLDTNRNLSLSALPRVISKLYNLPNFPTYISEESDLVFTQAIFPDLPYRLRIRTDNKYFDFVSERFWTNHQSFEEDLNEFLEQLPIQYRDSKSLYYFKSQLNFKKITNCS